MLITSMQSYFVDKWKYTSKLYHFAFFFFFFSFFFINIDFRVRRNVLQRGDDFLFHGSNRGNFIKVPSANLDRSKKPLSQFLTRRLPITFWPTLLWKWFHSDVHYQICNTHVVCIYCSELFPSSWTKSVSVLKFHESLSFSFFCFCFSFLGVITKKLYA